VVHGAYILIQVGTLEGCTCVAWATHVFYKLGLGCWNSYGIIYLFILYVLVHDTSEIILQESGPKRLSIR
jgi:hypothetical protein